MAAIPVIKHCNQLRPDLTVLMTTTTLSASEVIRNRLPAGVIHQAIHFQSLQAPPSVINFSGDLKYVVNENDASEGWIESAADLEAHFGHRKVWIASSIHKGEEEAILGVHYELIRMHPDMITIIAPRHPQHGREIAQELWNRGQSVSLRSQHKKLNLETSIYVVDTLGELRDFYKITPIAVIGGSFVPGLAGHNISEAAAAGCAILTGQHIGHFSHMVLEMQKLNPLSVLQVSSKLELGEALKELFSNSEVLKARQTAAKQAFHTLSSGIVEKVWNLLNLHVLRRLCLENK